MHVVCPHCAYEFESKAGLGGRTQFCPSCKKMFEAGAGSPPPRASRERPAGRGAPAARTSKKGRARDERGSSEGGERPSGKARTPRRGSAGATGAAKRPPREPEAPKQHWPMVLGVLVVAVALVGYQTWRRNQPDDPAGNGGTQATGPKRPSRSDVKARLVEANEHIEAHEYGKAAAIYRAILKTQPDQARAKVGLARVEKLLEADALARRFLEQSKAGESEAPATYKALLAHSHGRERIEGDAAFEGGGVQIRTWPKGEAVRLDGLDVDSGNSGPPSLDLGPSPVIRLGLRPGWYRVSIGEGTNALQFPVQVKSLLMAGGLSVDERIDLEPIRNRGRSYIPSAGPQASAFLLDRSETTCSKFLAFLKAIPQQRRNVYAPLADIWWTNPSQVMQDQRLQQLPAYGVTLPAAIAYCLWSGKRLPTRQEWLRAARPLPGWRFPWGSAPRSAEPANMPGAVGTGLGGRDVGPYGVYDLALGTSEWVLSAELEGTTRSFGAALGGNFLEPRRALDEPVDLHGMFASSLRTAGLRGARTCWAGARPEGEEALLEALAKGSLSTRLGVVGAAIRQKNAAALLRALQDDDRRVEFFALSALHLAGGYGGVAARTAFASAEGKQKTRLAMLLAAFGDFTALRLLGTLPSRERRDHLVMMLQLYPLPERIQDEWLIALFDQLLDMELDDARAVGVALGYAFGDEGPQRTIQALAKHPQRGSVVRRLNELSETLLRTEWWTQRHRTVSEARRLVTVTLTLSPRLTQLWYYRGSYNTRLKLYDQAISDYTRCLALEPTDPDMRRLCHNNRAAMRWWSGKLDLKLILEDTDAAIKAGPKEPNPHFFRGATLVAFKRYDEAIFHLQRCHELNERYLSDRTRLNSRRQKNEVADVLKALSLKCFKLQEPKDYEKLIRGMSRKLPGSPIVRYMEACVDLRKGDLDSALAMLEALRDGGTIDAKMLRKMILVDRDFAAHRDTPQFKELLASIPE